MKRVAIVQVKRWTLAEYERMVEVGAFEPGARLELLGGEIVEKTAPQHAPHATGVQLATRVAERLFGAGYDVRVQLPLAIAPDSEPEPDVAVVAGGPRDYSRKHPTTAVLVVEVADSTLAYDRRKAGVYARAAVPEYWIVDLGRETVEIYTGPRPDDEDALGASYSSVRTLGRAESFAPFGAPSASVAVADLLP